MDLVYNALHPAVGGASHAAYNAPASTDLPHGAFLFLNRTHVLAESWCTDNSDTVHRASGLLFGHRNVRYRAHHLCTTPKRLRPPWRTGGIGHEVGRVGLRAVVHHPHRTLRGGIVRRPRLVWTAVHRVAVWRRLHQSAVDVSAHVLASPTQHTRQDELVLAPAPTHAVRVAGVGVQRPLRKVCAASVEPFP